MITNSYFMNRIIKTMLILFLFFTLTFCHKNGNECKYNEYEGKAIIISIGDAPSNENNCPNNPRKVMFAFVPLDSSVRKDYIFKNWSDTTNMTINAGLNPSQQLLDSLGISIGAEFTCKRQEITQGTCTPVCFIFPGLNLNSENGCR